MTTPLPLIGLQLYSLRREFAVDPQATLGRVKGLGYDLVELAGTYGWSAGEWNRRLAEAGLSALSAHLEADSFENERDLEAQIAFYAEIGVHRLIYPYIPEDSRNEARYHRVAEILNQAGRRVRATGGEVFYHNHDFEFRELAGGRCGFDILLQNTDPALVRFEVDTFWVELMEKEAAGFITTHADRIGLIHAKELRRADKVSVSIGDGDIDFATILALAKQRTWPVVVEFEGEDAPEVVRKSAVHLRHLVTKLV